MKKIILIILLSIPSFLPGNPGEINRYFVNASGIARISAVNIMVYKKEIQKGGQVLVQTSYGTGTIISGNGYIVTNHHVVKKGDYFKVVSTSGTLYETVRFSNGEFYLSDLKTDLALLKIDNNSRESLIPVKFGDSNMLNEGEWVIAVGNPYGLKQSITAGIVSSKGRDNVGFTDIEDFIQTDVSINPGNSGGPLVNLYGELVGINTAIRTASGGFQGISFAIPSNIVKQVCSDLLAHGRVRRGWVGFIARERNLSGREGGAVEIISVIKNSPAELAGLKQGDIIYEIDGMKVDSTGSLVKIVGNKQIGSRVKIAVSRSGKLYDVNIILREKDEYTRIQKELAHFFRIYGIEIDEDAISGTVVISYISPNYSLNRDLVRGDNIISLNGFRISSLEDFIDKFKESGRRTNVMEISRDAVIYRIDLSNYSEGYE
jgi:S1-C subfamily serine protease